MPRLTVRRIAMLTIGWVLVGLGVIGLALPFLQGVLMILVGLAILSRESIWVRGHVSRYRSRHPELDRRMREVGDRARHLVPERWRGGAARAPNTGQDPGCPAGEDAGADGPDAARGVANPGRGWQNTPNDESEDPHVRS
jgi:hypothetical protein